MFLPPFDLLTFAVTVRRITIQAHIDFFFINLLLEQRIVLAGWNAGHDSYRILHRPGESCDSAASCHGLDKSDLLLTGLADGRFYLKIKCNAVSVMTIQVAVTDFANLYRPAVLRVKHAGIASMDNAAKFAKRNANLILNICLLFRMNHLRIPFACAILYTHPGA